MEFQDLAIVLVTEISEFSKKIFLFRREVKVKINIHKQLFNTKAFDLWSGIVVSIWLTSVSCNLGTMARLKMHKALDFPQ